MKINELNNVIERGTSRLEKLKIEESTVRRIFWVGVIIIIVSFVIRVLHIGVEYASFLDNIGTAFIIPRLVLWVTKYVSKKVKLFGIKPFELPDLIKDMKSEFLKLGITGSEIWADEKSLKKMTKEELRRRILESDETFLGEILKDNEVYTAIINKIIESKTHLSFKFLLLDPNSKFLKQREIEEDGKETGRLKEEVECTLKILKAIKRAISTLQLKNPLEFRTYDFMPSISLVCVDERMFVGPYIHGKHGYTTPWIEISGEEEKDEYREYKEVFDELWSEGNTTI